MNMKILIFILLLVTLVVTPCFGADLSELRNVLIKTGRQGYFPSHATYKVLPDICKKDSCFIIVTVDYETETLKGMRRIAILSAAGKYIGCYSGFDELPLDVEGNKLKFKKSEFGDTVEFQGIEPPKSMWVDGMIYKFEPAQEPLGLTTAIKQHLKISADSSAPKFQYSLFDLNGDGHDEAIVLITDDEYCGSGGCTLEIYRGTTHGFKFLSGSTITKPPIRVLEEHSHGWKSLIVYSYGNVVLKFNGNKYALNPSVQSKATVKQLSSAKILIESYEK